MNYQLHYDKLIERAKNRTLKKCKERHHIIPRCMGGTNDSINLVDLTPEEHLVAHLLLMKINNNSLLVYAAMRMHTRVKNNREYGFLRRAFSKMMSFRMAGENNPMYGKKHVDETKKKIGDKNRGRKATSITRKKLSDKRKGRVSGNKGKKCSPQTIEKMRKASSGKNNGMFGKKHSAETKEKIGKKSVGRKPRLGAKLSDETKLKCSISAKKRIPIICEYCRKSVSPSNYSRWHGNNCKLGDNNAD